MPKRTTINKQDSPTQERERLIAELSQVLSDDELIECLEACELAEDSLAALRSRRDAAIENMPHSSTNDLESAGIEVIPKTLRIREGVVRGELKEISVGYILRRKKYNAYQYAGRTMRWTVYGQAIAFKTKEDAEAAAKITMQSLADAQPAYDFPTVDASVTVPYAVGVAHERTPITQLNCRLSRSQSEKLYAMLRGLRKYNREIVVVSPDRESEKHNPVDSIADVVRYMLDHLTLPEGSE